jgi:DNA-binding transcriptional LysR family regulator
MVLAGLGVALLPTTAVANELRSGALRRIELVGTPRIERRIAALRRLDDEGRAPAATAFWALLQADPNEVTSSTLAIGPESATFR